MEDAIILYDLGILSGLPGPALTSLPGFLPSPQFLSENRGTLFRNLLRNGP